MIKLNEGDIAPPISGINQDIKKISLQDFKGKKVILFFYPKDSTPGCTAEACNLRDNYDMLLNKGFEIIGISVDSAASHQKFISKNSLPFNLIADEDKKIVNDYGVWGEKKMYGKTYEGIHRKTFIISEEGKIFKIIEKVNTKDHSQQILDEVKS